MRALQLQDTLDFPARSVFEHAAYDMAALSAFLPDVTRVVPQRCERPCRHELRRVDRWHGDGEGHALARVLDLDAACWEVETRWRFDRLEASWQVQVLEPAGVLSAEGALRVAPLEEAQTELQMTGELAFHPGKLGRGLSLAGAALSPLVEQRLASLVERNLAALLGAIEARLTQRAGREGRRDRHDRAACTQAVQDAGRGLVASPCCPAV